MLGLGCVPFAGRAGRTVLAFVAGGDCLARTYRQR
jgi:hypothetical protein